MVSKIIILIPAFSKRGTIFSINNLWRPRFLNRSSFRFIFALLFFFSASGCATIDRFCSRQYPAEKLAALGGLEKFYINTNPFVLTAYGRFRKSADTVRVYIEGDGYAWRSRSVPSDDPTPLRPLVIALASQDLSSNVVYLARPGQYPASGVPSCSYEYWTSKRLSEEVVNSMNQAIDQIKLKAGTSKVELIGFSGGAAIAVLIAARRQDVVSLRTIAGNLDHVALSRFHKVDTLTGSLNPIDYVSLIRNIPQLHFVAEKDRVVPLFIAQSFAERLGDASHQSIIVVKDTTHDSGWEAKWSELLSMPLFTPQDSKVQGLLPLKKM